MRSRTSTGRKLSITGWIEVGGTGRPGAAGVCDEGDAGMQRMPVRSAMPARSASEWLNQLSCSTDRTLPGRSLALPAGMGPARSALPARSDSEWLNQLSCSTDRPTEPCRAGRWRFPRASTNRPSDHANFPQFLWRTLSALQNGFPRDTKTSTGLSGPADSVAWASSKPPLTLTPPQS